MSLFQFRLSLLFVLTLICASGCAGWFYFGEGGAGVGLLGMLCLVNGVFMIRVLRRKGGADLAFDTGFAAMWFLLSAICFGMLAYFFFWFYREYGYGWWYLMRPES